MTTPYGQCIVRGCTNEASFDAESNGYFSRCSRCAEFSGTASGFVHMHRAYLGNYRWTDHEVTAGAMSIVALDQVARTITLGCTHGGCDLVATFDLDDTAERAIEREAAGAYLRHKRMTAAGRVWRDGWYQAAGA